MSTHTPGPRIFKWWPDDAARVRAIGQEAATELIRAMTIHAPFHSPHEGYAVILEELDELKDEVWASKPGSDRAAMRKEAIQVAAMALRFVQDVCDLRELDR